MARGLFGMLLRGRVALAAAQAAFRFWQVRVPANPNVRPWFPAPRRIVAIRLDTGSSLHREAKLRTSAIAPSSRAREHHVIMSMTSIQSSGSAESGRQTEVLLFTGSQG